MKILFLSLVLAAMTFYFASRTVEHTITSYPEWCDYLSGENIQSRYTSWWNLNFRLHADKEALRALYLIDYIKKYNAEYGVQNKRVAWVEGSVFHIVNPSSFGSVKPEVFLNELRGLLDEMRAGELPATECSALSLGLLFSQIRLHSLKYDLKQGRYLDDEQTFGLERGDAVRRDSRLIEAEKLLSQPK